MRKDFDAARIVSCGKWFTESSSAIQITDGFGWGGGHLDGRLFWRNESWFVEDMVRPNRVKFIFPASDDDGCDTVSDHVRHRAGLGHKPVDAENEDHAFDGDRFHRR